MGRKIYSPFRYPGGKGNLTPFITNLLKKNKLIGSSYAEPFAGGAGAALALLANNAVSDITLNDRDSRIIAAWEAILNTPERLIERLSDESVSIDNWKKQRKIYFAAKDRDFSFDIGFATFFLNRCNVSGVLHGGVIGGVNQQGKYKIDARFIKEKLIERIKQIASQKCHINLSCLDAVDFIKAYYKENPNAFIYLDPPYYKQGKNLYLNFYKHDDHVNLSKLVKKYENKDWLISYDNVPEIERMYTDQNFKCEEHQLYYSLNKVRKCTEILVLPPHLSMPNNT